MKQKGTGWLLLGICSFSLAIMPAFLLDNGIVISWFIYLPLSMSAGWFGLAFFEKLGPANAGFACLLLWIGTWCFFGVPLVSHLGDPFEWGVMSFSAAICFSLAWTFRSYINSKRSLTEVD